ncbi:MAG TPA: PAS domain S-box protein [Hydrogenophaga sp.]|uniref:sensor histidine kinase n=1 Tax=Hydrogenophaga sp. TaxID=1904254 RepID=UPI002C03031F|nr:PAS domain S-box protein [Hydrogenophaga sp.]HSX94792.1 PAS domain S-box protein [Hydrogenophaga sp.]
MAGNRKRSVQLWLPLLPAAVALLLLALMVWSVERVVGDELERRAEQRVEQTSAIFADRLSRVLNGQATQLDLLTLAPRQKVSREGWRLQMDRLRERNRGYVWIGATDADGLVLAASDGLLEGVSIAQRPVYLKGREGAWFGSLNSPVSLREPLTSHDRPAPRNLADIAMPYEDAEGRPAGVLAAHLDAAFYDGLREDVLGPPAARRGLQLELADVSGRRLLGERAPLSPTQWQDLLDTPVGAPRVFHTEDGESVLLVRHGVDRATLSLTTEWQVVAWQPMALALAPVRELERYVLLWGGATVLLVGLGGFWLSSRLARPFNQMIDVVAERLGPQSDAAPGTVLRVIAEQMRRLPAQGSGGSRSEQTLTQVLHDASRLQAVLQHLPSPMYLVDMDFRVLFWNDAAERMFGWSAAEAEGRHVDEIFRDKDPDNSARRAIRPAMLAEQGPWSFETHLLRRDGSDIWGEWRLTKVFGADGEAIGLLAQVRDLTVERLSEMRLREQGEVLSALINSASDAVISVDLHGRISLFNPAAARIFGREAEAMIGQPLDSLLPPEHRGEHLALMQRFSKSTTSTRPMGFGRVKGVRADGAELELEASISHITVRGQKLLTAILRDVTERVRAEQALARYQLELSELTQRLLTQEQTTTRELAQTLHDQLGQTLGAIRLSFDSLSQMSRELLPPRAQERSATVGRQIDHAIAEVRQALVRLRPPMLEDLGLTAALDNEIRQRAAEAEPVTLHLQTVGEVITQRWPDDVEYAAFMVARESVANALKHAAASRVVVRIEGDATHLRLDIVDDGTGLAEEMAFGRPGHLGMVGMRERALAIGARLSARARSGRGTRVTLIWTARPDSVFGELEVLNDPEN